MQSFRELELVIPKGEDAFQAFIKAEQELDKDLLRRRFLLTNGEKSTILNYLIRRHKNSRAQNMAAQIRYLLDLSPDISTDQPVHLLLKLKKFSLFKFFIKKPDIKEIAEADSIFKPSHFLQLACRDKEGQTLLARAIATGKGSLLSTLLEYKLDPNEPNTLLVNNVYCDMQPLHQAVYLDFPEAIVALLVAGAEIASPCGTLQETPVLIAAKYGKINALATLLAHSGEKLELNAENAEAKRPIELLCDQLGQQIEFEKTLKGIAILLCHGADVPRDENFRTLLMDNRLALLAEVKKYSQALRSPSTKFIRACHDKNNPLHNIIYAPRSWIEALWRMFGASSEEVFLVESLVFDLEEDSHSKFSRLLNAGFNKDEQGQQRPTEDFSQDERKFAEFVWRYRQDFRGVFKNPFSSMFGKLTAGECTSIKEVYDYAEQFHQDQDGKKIRSELILKAMDEEKLAIHENLDTGRSEPSFSRFP
jgi:ankyrin repeat protein